MIKPVKKIIESKTIRRFEDLPNGRRAKKEIKINCYYHSILHNKGGPAVRKDNGEEWWYDMGVIHRSDGGPAVTTPEGKYWYVQGKYHREGFPAIVMNNGHREWYLDGLRHRIDGPAVEDPKKGNEWWENGVFIRKEE